MWLHTRWRYGPAHACSGAAQLVWARDASDKRGRKGDWGKGCLLPSIWGIDVSFWGIEKKKLGKEDLPQHVFFFNPLYCWLQGKGISFPESGGDALRKHICTTSCGFHNNSSSIQVRRCRIPSLCRRLLRLVFTTISSLLHLRWFFHHQPRHLHLQTRSIRTPWYDLLFPYAWCFYHVAIYVDVVRFN